jgi:indolepyruvate ferredoxin oxidoreductase, alpha subunit
MSETPNKKVVLLGNEAIGRGLVEAGCQLVMSYPGTPSSEILPSYLRAARAENVKVHGEWSANEKVAFEEALAAAYTGKRAAVVMKQVGLNVAADPMMSAAYIGVKGGFVIICADDPGPHSSQTEQDTRMFGLFAKLPVLDPASPDEARRMVPYAFELSERYEIPVILRPSLRICHGRESCELATPGGPARRAEFVKDTHRWAATPHWRLGLHKQLNEKLRRIAEEFESSPWNEVLDTGAASPLAIIATGMPFATISDILAERGLKGRIPILKVGAVFPFPRRTVEGFAAAYEHVLVVEEPDQVVELQLKRRVMGRADGTVPDEGELTAGVLTEVLGRVLHAHGLIDAAWTANPEAKGVVEELKLPIRPASLCPGCPHRSAFYAIRKTFGKKGIYTSDIGCYTLGLNLDAVDTCHDMGAAISMATGFYHAYAHDGGEVPAIVATIGDSTFYHAGLPALAGAVYSNARYILVILDNLVTAMTGMQPTLALGQQADGSLGAVLPLEDACAGLGAKFVRVHDPYDLAGMAALLKEAHEHCRSPEGRVAVIIARHPCLLNDKKSAAKTNTHPVRINDKCNGCAFCRTTFECQALVPGAPIEGKENRFLTTIDRRVCASCGQCVTVCNRGAIEEQA